MYKLNSNAIVDIKPVNDNMIRQCVYCGCRKDSQNLKIVHIQDHKAFICTDCLEKFQPVEI